MFTQFEIILIVSSVLTGVAFGLIAFHIDAYLTEKNEQKETIK